MSDDLVAFLKARLDEDEQAARAATAGPWAALDGGVMSLDNESWPVASTETDQERADRVHIARWDPARVLAEVQAKRRLIERVRVRNQSRDGGGARPGVGQEAREIADQLGHARPSLTQDVYMERNVATAALRDVLQFLALPYAEHPDYRAEWAPTEDGNRG